MTHWTSKALFLAAIIGAIMTIQEPARAESREPVRLAVWSEFLPLSQVRTHLPLLRERGIAIHLAVTNEMLSTEEFYSFWAEARARGVDIRPWLLLSEELGYWANKWNAPEIEKLVERFLLRLEEHGLSTDWITLDFEPPPSFDRDLTAALSKKDYLGAWKLLVRSAHLGSFRDAQAIYRELVDRLHRRGILVHAVTTPFVIHDLKNHDYRVQNTFGVPIQDVPFDEVSFMVYRPEYQKFLGKVNSDIVYAYARKVRKHFGDQAAIDLGEVGYVPFPVPKQGYSDPKELRTDFAAALAGGVRRLHVYSLDGLAPDLDKPGTLETWMALPKPKKPKRDFKTRFYLWVVDVLANLLPKPDR